MGSTAGADFQSLLRVTDSLSLTQVDLPVHAVSTSLAGVWLGLATITQVSQIVGQNATDATTGNSTFPIRLLVHMNEAGATTLLQQVYIGNVPPVAGSTPPGSAIALNNTAFKAAGNISNVIRLSSATFPLDLTLGGTGQLGSGDLIFNFTLGYNDATNPFVHTYHPDHDNLDARFNPILQPVESYNVTRAIKLHFTPSLNGVSDPSFGSTILGGTYTETISGLRSQDINVSGIFVLHRVSDAASLLTQ